MVRCIALVAAWVVVGVFVAAPVMGQAARKPAAADPAKRKEAAERWLKEGKDSLGAGAYEAARDRFSDVLEIDPRNGAAQHGLALAYAGLGDLKRAQGAVQGALDAEVRAGGVGKLSKPVLMNYAMVMISAKEPMRAVKALTDYQRLAGKPDEAVLNALAVALNTADPSLRRSSAYSAAAKFYEEQNAKLEAGRPGEKRWGISWRSAADYEQFSAMWKQDVAELEKLYQQVALKEEELAAIQLRHARAQELVDKTGFVPATMNYIKTTLASTQKEYDDLVEQYKTRAGSIRKPTLPVTMSAVPMDASGGEALAALVAPADPMGGVASATPTVRRPTRRTRPGATGGTTGGGAVGTNTVGGNTGTPGETPVAVVEKPKVVAPSQSETPELVVPKAAGKRTVIRPAAGVAIGPDLLLTSAAAVEGAKEIQVTDLAGGAMKGEVLRSDSNLGLALVKVEGGKLLYGQVGDAFRGGTVQCVSLAPSIFQPVAETIPGSVKVNGVEWTLTLQRMPKRAGSPIVSANKVIGIELGDRSADLAKVPVVGVEAVRQFCGEDLAKAKGPFGNPNEVMCELLVTSEVE